MILFYNLIFCLALLRPFPIAYAYERSTTSLIYSRLDSLLFNR